MSSPSLEPLVKWVLGTIIGSLFCSGCKVCIQTNT